MNKDRGMIKWIPFNSVVSNKEVLMSIMKEKAKVNITYYKNGYTYEYNGTIKKIDSSNKLIYLTNCRLLFNQIIKVTEIK